MGTTADPHRAATPPSQLSQAAARPPSLSDIAKLAGVSVMTVSRVANNGSGVGRATRDRIQGIMRELGYQQNATARALRTGRRTAIGVLFAPPTSLRSSAVLASVEQAAAAEGFDVNLTSIKTADPGAVARALERLRNAQVAAILVLAPQVMADDALQSAARDIPVVVVGTSDADGPGRSTVVVNHQQGAYDVTTHLLNLGHATVHHISGPPEWNPSQLRIDGWRRALTDAGRPVPPPAAGDWTPRSGHHAAREILSDDVTALFVSSDAMAVGALAASRELGRRVPDDLSIAGFDDDPIAEFLDPPLTTVKFDAVKLGPVMVRLALEQLSSSIDPAPSVHLDVELVIRNSTGPCR